MDDGVFLSKAMKDDVPEESRLSTGVVYRLLDFADRAKDASLPSFLHRKHRLGRENSRCKRFMEYEDKGRDKDKGKRPVLRERDWLLASALRYTAFRNIKDESVLYTWRRNVE